MNWRAIACLLIMSLLISCNNKYKNVPADCIDESKIDPDAICTMEYAPVCGCDGKTYSNACQASNNGVTTWTKGPCSEDSALQVPEDCIDESLIDPEAMCTEEYDPVCGCNGKTYGNACFARIAGVTAWRAGTCE